MISREIAEREGDPILRGMIDRGTLHFAYPASWGRAMIDSLLPRALGGGVLRGASPLRFVYLDEAGVSAPQPVVVVAGLIVHADKHWRRLHARLNELAQKCFPDGIPEGFFFHADDIMQGNKPFEREKWQLPKRLAVLQSLLSIAMEVQVPVAYGYIRKKPEWTLPDPRDAEAWYHTCAFGFCAMAAEDFMRTEAWQHEVATLVAEHRQNSPRHIKYRHKMMASDSSPLHDIGGFRRLLPFRCIVDTPHFVAKTEAPLIQLADAYAFAITKLLAKRAHAETFCPPLTEVINKTEPPDKAGNFSVFRICQRVSLQLRMTFPGRT
jgi:hypothetical protein